MPNQMPHSSKTAEMRRFEQISRVEMPLARM
jgi:hypothetical protein